MSTPGSGKTSTIDTKKFSQILLRDLLVQQKTLERAIEATPTGPKRNDLCDSNIHLAMAMVHLARSLAR